MSKTLLALLVFAALARRAAAVGGSYVTFSNRDSGGGSLAVTQLDTVTDCQQLCTADAKCYGYTFVPGASATDPGNCYRKGVDNCDPVAIKNTDAGTFTGVMGSSCTFMCGGQTISNLDGCAVTPYMSGPTGGAFVNFVDRDSGGGAISVTQTSSATDCLQACNASPSCYGYTFTGGNCYFKGANSCDPNAIQQTSPGIDSGITGDSCTFTCGNRQESNLDGCSVSGFAGAVPSGASRRLRRSMGDFVLAERNSELCPPNLSACSLNGLFGDGYECVNLDEELERCGACSNDCTASPGAKGVTCRQGRCMVTSCVRGYRLVDGDAGDGHCQKRTKRAAHGHRELSHTGRLESF